MNHYSLLNSSSPRYKIIIMFAATSVVALTLIVCVKLFQYSDQLQSKWTEYQYQHRLKYQLLSQLQQADNEFGLLGDIQRYAITPDTRNEKVIQKQLGHYQIIINQYKNIANLTNTEQQLLTAITFQYTQLEQQFINIKSITPASEPSTNPDSANGLDSMSYHALLKQLRAFIVNEQLTTGQQLNGRQVKIHALIYSLIMLLLVAVVTTTHYWRTRRQLAAKNTIDLDDELIHIFNDSTCPALIVNDLGQIINANHSLCELSGWTPSQIKTMKIDQLLPDIPIEIFNKLLVPNDWQSLHNCPVTLISNNKLSQSVLVNITQWLHTDRVFSSISCQSVATSQTLADEIDAITQMYNFNETTNDIGSWRWDFRHDRLLCSPKTCEIIGCDHNMSPMTQQSMLNAIPAHERDVISEIINKTITLGNELNISHHIEVNGNDMLVKQHGHIVNDETGKPRFLLGTIRAVNTQQSTMNDITDSLFNSSLDAMVITDANNIILKVNNAFVSITGFNKKDTIGQPLSQVNRSIFFDQCIYLKINEHVQQKNQWTGEVWNVRHGGEVYPTTQYICALTREDGDITSYLCIFRDISAQKLLEERIEQEQSLDSVTLLPARAVLLDRLTQAIKRHDRDGNKCAVLMISIKSCLIKIPQKYHLEIIKILANRLSLNTRTHDTISRFGHYEFAALIEGLNLSEDAYVVAEKLKLKISDPIIFKHKSIYPKCAIGISLHPLHATDGQVLLRYADTAMQQAKSNKHDNIQTFNQHIFNIYTSEQHLKNQLHRAIDLNELAVQYQPVISFHSQQMVRCIAHVRWHHSAYNTQETNNFITSAKGGSLSKPLHCWLLENAIKHAAQWHNPTIQQLDIQIKIVAGQLAQPGLAQEVKNILNTYQFSPLKLILEIHHDILCDDMGIQHTELASLTAIGVRILVLNVDNSLISLNYLKQHHIDQAIIKQFPIADPKLSSTLSLASKQVIRQLKSADIYPANFDWQQHTCINAFKHLNTLKQEQLLVCGSVDTNKLILLGNTLHNTPA